jgi:hypothetical protein
MHDLLLRHAGDHRPHQIAAARVVWSSGQRQRQLSPRTTPSVHLACEQSRLRSSLETTGLACLPACLPAYESSERPSERLAL